MFSSFFAPTSILLQGLIAGFIFGFLLQRGKVSRFNTIVGQFLFYDYTVLKIMLTAIVVGGIGAYGLLELGYISTLPLKASSLIGSTLGGIIFGVGMAILGYCPGTSIAALAEGARDVLFGFIGMLLGTAAYELSYPWFNEFILSKDTTNSTLASLFQISHWQVFLLLGIMATILFYLLEKKYFHRT